MTHSNFITIHWQKQTPHSKWGQLTQGSVSLQKGGSTQAFECETENRKLCILGHPFIGSTIDLDKFAQTYLNSELTDIFLQSINGEFLILEIDQKQDHLRIINSRFASPIFWYVLEESCFWGSSSYYHLCQQLIAANKFHLAPQAFYETLNFKRLFGNSTFDTKSQYLTPASVLTITPNKHTHNTYWRIQYQSNNQSLAQNADTLGFLIKESIKKKTSDKKRYGMFLSGGLDTRTLLAHFDEPPHCFTLTYSKNREFQVAKQLAHWKGATHTWIQVQEGHYRKHLRESIEIPACMYIPNAFFLGHQASVTPHVDVLFAGYGFDYFFQGMYLPAQTFQVLGRSLLYKRLQKLPRDLTSFFLDNISYRVKGHTLLPLLKQNKRIEMEDYLREKVGALVEEAKAVAEDPYNVWEYLSLGNLSRHYTYVGQLCLMTLGEFRTLSYENDLYDFYLNSPPTQRFDAAIFRKALQNANPQFYKFMSANHGYPAGYSSFQRALLNLQDRAKTKLMPKRKKQNFNIKFERTWLPVDHLLRTEFADMIQDLKSSSQLSQLDIFDMDMLSRTIDQWQDGHVDGDQLFMMLLSIDQFLKMLEAPSPSSTAN